MFILIIRGRICFHFRRDFINGEENQALSTHLQYSSNCGPNAHHDLYHFGQGMKNLVIQKKIKHKTHLAKNIWLDFNQFSDASLRLR